MTAREAAAKAESELDAALADPACVEKLRSAVRKTTRALDDISKLEGARRETIDRLLAELAKEKDPEKLKTLRRDLARLGFKPK